jgi:hypothetical protein
MGAASDLPDEAVPVTFHYKARYDEGSHFLRYGHLGGLPP